MHVGQRDARDINHLRIDVMRLGGPALKILGDLADHLLGLAFHDVVGLGNRRIVSAGDRPAHHGSLAALFGARNLLLHRGALHNHAAEEHHVRPIQVRILQALDV